MAKIALGLCCVLALAAAGSSNTPKTSKHEYERYLQKRYKDLLKAESNSIHHGPNHKPGQILLGHQGEQQWQHYNKRRYLKKLKTYKLAEKHGKKHGYWGEEPYQPNTKHDMDDIRLQDLSYDDKIIKKTEKDQVQAHSSQLHSIQDEDKITRSQAKGRLHHQKTPPAYDERKKFHSKAHYNKQKKSVFGNKKAAQKGKHIQKKSNQSP